MVVYSKKHFVFTTPDGGVMDVPREHIGDLPDWVTKTDLFKMAVKDASITIVPTKGKTGKGASTPPNSNETQQ